MVFTATPLDGSATPIPMGSVVPDGTNTPVPLEGGPIINTGGNNLAPAQMYIKDGNNVTFGAEADAAITDSTQTTKTHMAFLKGLVKIFADIWDSTNHWLQVKVMNGNPNGQNTMANSAPVAIASDQSSIPVKGGSTEVIGNGVGVVNGINTDLFGWIDVSAYKSFSLQTTGTWAATLTVQGSNDGATPITTNILALNATDAFFIGGTITANGVYYGAIATRYIRVRATSWSSNASLAGIMELYSTPLQSLIQMVTMNQGNFAYTVQQSGTWTVQPGNTQNTTPWLVQGPTTKATQAANTAGNVVVKGSAGALWSAVVTTLGTAQLDIFDNVSTNSGTKLLSIPASAAVGSIYSFPGGQPAANGIVSAGVANCPAVTFSYH